MFVFNGRKKEGNGSLGPTPQPSKGGLKAVHGPDPRALDLRNGESRRESPAKPPFMLQIHVPLNPRTGLNPGPPLLGAECPVNPLGPAGLCLSFPPTLG